MSETNKNIMILYKYLPYNFAEDLYYKGKVHFKHAKHFCEIEEDGVRGDKYDGSEIFNTSTLIKDSSGEKTIPIKSYTQRSQEELKSTYIFCTSKTFSSKFFHKFESDTCIVIKDVDEFRKRIEKNLDNVNLNIHKSILNIGTKQTKMLNFKISFHVNFYFDDVIYFDEEKCHDTIILKTNLYQKFFHKRKRFGWQDEYRFLFEPKNNEVELFFNNEEDENFYNHIIRNNSFNISDFLPKGINLEIGSIEDISEIKKL